MSDKNFDFEKAFRRLEKIVEELESSDLELEETIERFKTGSRLARQCLDRLQSVKIRVKEVIGEEKGHLKTKRL